MLSRYTSEIQMLNADICFYFYFLVEKKGKYGKWKQDYQNNIKDFLCLQTYNYIFQNISV